MALNGAGSGINGTRNGGDPGAGPATKRLRSEGDGWLVRSSRQALACVNPVRSCEEQYFKEAMENRDTTKELIKLSIGE